MQKLTQNEEAMKAASRPTIESVLGPLREWPMTDFFGSRFKQNWSPYGIQGLADIVGDRVDILTCIAANPGRRHFTRMLYQLKQAAQTIVVYEVFNDRFAAFLARQGFAKEAVVEDGEGVEIYVWRKL